jgi:glycosyltransferase involved in cell wall biosynthesis
MNKLFCLNENYSTTKLYYKLIDNKFLDKNGKIKEEYKFKLNFPEFGIIDSKIPAKEGEKFETYLFLPEGEGRKGEGGLRTKGYFKFSYENLIMNDKCLILNDENGNEFVADKETLACINSTFNIQHSTLKKLPLISIITVVYNGEKYLEETIQSVINQTYPNVEYIIIDGGSTDGTLDIIKKYEDYIDYWVSEKDRGVYDAMNKGLQLSLGEYITILNADDHYEKDSIANLLFCLLNSKKDYAVGKVKFIESKVIIKPIFPLEENKIYQEMPYPHVSALINRKMYKNIGLFNTSFKIAGDHDIALRIHLKGYECCYLNKIVANLHTGGMSNSYKSNYESMKVVVFNGKNVFSAALSFVIQVLKLLLAKNLPKPLVKKIQKIKKSRYYD